MSEFYYMPIHREQMVDIATEHRRAGIDQAVRALMIRASQMMDVDRPDLASRFLRAATEAARDPGWERGAR